MEAPMPTISTCLTYATQAEEAVNHYLSVFDGRISSTMRAGEGGPLPAGSAMSVTFELFGQTIIALNAGATFGFTPGMSLFVTCDTQEEIDRYWSKLLAAGAKEVQCGWITDSSASPGRSSRKS
jgi:predicted 3-demethylubiquinone-9 3-methyltransferase (glyoxalase superfamily)